MCRYKHTQRRLSALACVDQTRTYDLIEKYVTYTPCKPQPLSCIFVLFVLESTRYITKSAEVGMVACKARQFVRGCQIIRNGYKYIQSSR